MKMITKAIGVCVLIFMLSFTYATAQFSIGASYDTRFEDPTAGFGVHFENQIYDYNDVIFSVRGNFAWASATENETLRGIPVEREYTSYDVGMGLMIGYQFSPYVKPYLGGGLGLEGYNLTSESRELLPVAPEGVRRDTALQYYALIGVAAYPIPELQPFVQYRIGGVDSDIMPGYSSVQAGVMFRF